MDLQHARSIATRADSIRPALIGSGMTPLRYALSILCLVGFIVAYLALSAVLRHWGLHPFVAMVVAVAPGLVFIVVVSRWLKARRAAKTRIAADTMLCPRCRCILREEGPAHWDSCDATIRICPQCANAVADDVYAAATLPVLRARLRVKHERSLRGIVTGLWPLAAFFVGMLALVPLADFLDRLRLAGSNQVFVWGMIVVFLTFGAGLIYAMPRVHRFPDARTARWLDAPFCVECDAPFPPGALESPILRCSSCDGLLSTAVAVRDSNAARADARLFPAR